MALPHPYYNNPPAYMGFVGFLKLRTGNVVGTTQADSNYSHGEMIVRANSADINLSQDVTKPDVIDSRYDRTVYQLGPKVIEGSFSFPAVYDAQSGANIVEALYRYAITRNSSGLLSPFDLDVKYASSNSAPNVSDFIYFGNIVNSWTFSVSNEDVVTINVDMIGLTREFNESTIIPAADLTNTRIVTWNDARVEISGGRITNTIGGQFVRAFEATVANNAERFYTLNKNLFAQAIAPTKRDITGNITLMGRHQDLANLALSNESYCSEAVQVKFGFETLATGEGCESTFGVTLPNCVFQIEEMSLSNELFETRVDWHSLPAAGTGIDDPLIANLGATFTY